MPYGKRLWRTESGTLVEDGHPEARSLAYGTDDPLSDEDAELVTKGHTPKAEAPVTPKRAAKPVAKPE